MKIPVSDTLALVDLERGSLLEATFRMSFEFTVPDLLYDRELKNHGGGRLCALGLRIAELEGDGVMRALEYRRRKPALSLPDCFALTLAARGDWILLTGDRELRRLAVSEHVERHGVLWLMDRTGWSRLPARRPGNCMTVSKRSSRTQDAGCPSERFAPDWSDMQRFFRTADQRQEHRP